MQISQGCPPLTCLPRGINSTEEKIQGLIFSPSQDRFFYKDEENCVATATTGPITMGSEPPQRGYKSMAKTLPHTASCRLQAVRTKQFLMECRKLCGWVDLFKPVQHVNMA